MWWMMAHALAGNWTVGEAVELPTDGPVVSAVVGQWGGEPAVFVASESAVSVLQDGTRLATLEHAISTLWFTDHDGDGRSELLACGPDGLAVLRAGQPGFGGVVALGTDPCVQVVGDGSNGLYTWTGEALQHWQPGKGWDESGLAGSTPPPVDGEGLSAPDGDGWAVATADPPSLQRPGGEVVSLPSAPVWMRAFGAGGYAVGLGGNSLALQRPGQPVEVVTLPSRADVVDGADVDGDGCLDLAAFASDGSQAFVFQGVCEDLPVQPTRVDLGASWSAVSLDVGESVDLPLVDAVNGWTQFAHKGGPRSLRVEEGRLIYEAQPSDVGMWRVSIRMAGEGQERWSGVVLRVASLGTPQDDAAAVGLRVPDPIVEHEAPLDTTPREKGFFGFRECLVGAGVAAGLSKNAQADWANVGLPDAVPSASPAVTMVCSGGAPKVRWFLGADSAPAYFYLAPGGRMNHVLAGTFGMEWRPGALRVGPFVTAGLVVFGGGLRTVWAPFETKKGANHGFEFRFTAYPSNLSGQALLAYTWEFGEF